MKDLHALIGRAASAMTQRRGDISASEVEQNALDGLLFMGNPHETVPRALLLDQRLGAVDVLGWQVIRLLSNPDRTTAFPTYDELEPLLRPGAGQNASRKTVARVIAILRLTRWMTLGMRARNTTNGRMIGNIYVLHDEPLAPAEALSLDTGYIEYVVRCTHHGNKAVAAVARLVKEELATTGVLESPTHLDVIDQRAARQRKTEFLSETKSETTQFPMETRGKSPSSLRKLREFPNGELQSFQRKLMGNSEAYDLVSSGNSATTVRTNTNTVCTNRTAPARGALVWSWPLEFTSDERETASLMLTGLSNEVQQAVIDEAAGRLEAGKVKSPMGFLHTLAKRAAAGQFHLTHFGQAIANKRNEGVEVATGAESFGAWTRDVPRQSSNNLATASGTPVNTEPLSEETEKAREAMLKRLGIRR